VQSGSEADRAGLKPNDVIVSINGTPAVNVERQIEALGPGTVLKLRIRREGVQQDFQWTLTVRKVDVWHLQNAPSVTAEQKAARAAWLFGRATN
jgi:serine protease Do